MCDDKTANEYKVRFYYLKNFKDQKKNHIKWTLKCKIIGRKRHMTNANPHSFSYK